MDDALVGLILNTLTAACLQELRTCQGIQTVVAQAQTLPALQGALRRHNEQYDKAEIACRGQLEPHLVGAQCNVSIFFVLRPPQERRVSPGTDSHTQTLPARSR
jgi:hypothetical protein